MSNKIVSVEIKKNRSSYKEKYIVGVNVDTIVTTIAVHSEKNRTI